jgi:DNA-binding CsgD family transcriptional regulator
MEKPTAKSIPSGLTDHSVQFFVDNGDIVFLQDGHMHPFHEIDDFNLDLIRSDMDNHPKAIEAMVQLGITSPVKQLERYIYCNFGGFSDKADITPDGILRYDYWDCCEHGTCKHEGKLCHLPEGINGMLTRKEIEITQLIGQDLCDKEVASRLGISPHTVAIHRTHIEHKIGAHSKVGIALFAKDQKII